MTGVEGVAAAGGGGTAAGEQSQSRTVEALNSAVQQQLNLESVKTRAISLYKAISRILQDLDVIGRSNIPPKWQDMLGQFSMVNLELFNIVEDIKKVSKAFVVHPKNVNAENATIVPVMVSTKLLPEIETEDNMKKEQLLQGMQHLPIHTQIERLKARIDMIGAACESAEKVIAETRKAYFGTRQGPTMLPTIDKVQAAKIQEQENLLRNAVNRGEGLRINGDQRQTTSSLPSHLADVLNVGEGIDSSGMYMKNTPLSSNSNIPGTLIQGSGAQLIGRGVASPSVTTPIATFENAGASPLPYVNSPRSNTNMMNTPSPQQQPNQLQQQQQNSLQQQQQNPLQQQNQLQQQQQQQQQQQRQKMMHLQPHQQQLLAHQLRQSSMQGLGQNQLSQLNDLQGQGQAQAQQKIQPLHGQHQMQFSQTLGTQQFQGRQLSSTGMQHGMGQSQLTQGNQLNRQLNQFSSVANSALYNAAQSNPNAQMIPNMSAMLPSQSLPRMQFGMPGGNRNLAAQNLNDQMFNMGTTNQGSMMNIQQQQQQQQQQSQHGSQGAFGSIPQNSQAMQNNMASLQNPQQSHPNYQQQRPPTQQ